MHSQEIEQILLEWADEFNESLNKTNALCVALFGADKKLLFATPVMNILFKGEPYKSLINPTFDRLLAIKSDSSLVFEGLLTIGDYASINSSILAQVYLKKGMLLVIGGTDTAQLVDQNIAMHHLNLQINNLQRQLLKEKLTLENTLNQLSETNSLLQQVNDSKDKFFSIIGHDLRSPFSSIVGLSNLLVEQIKVENNEGIELYGDLIIKSSNKAMDLLMNLIEWSRSQTGRMEFNPEYFDMVSCINKIILLYDDIARQKSITIKSIIPQKTSVFADNAMISTVLRNLVSNAIKFTMPGGEIIVSAINKQNELIFSVSDRGVGISKNSIEKLFRIDQSFSTTGTNKETGTGLGLILCKDFVEKHSGKIWVESDQGKGSTFYFSLPYNAGPQEKNVIEKAGLAVAENYGNPAVSGLKILIAEDDEISKMLLDIEVKTLCREILKVRTGIEAVEICRNNRDIDLILMDIQMPEMDGYEATQQIRQFNKEVVIIAQTALVINGAREKSIESGCNDYIAKPIKKNELFALIQKYFGQ